MGVRYVVVGCGGPAGRCHHCHHDGAADTLARSAPRARASAVGAGGGLGGLRHVPCRSCTAAHVRMQKTGETLRRCPYNPTQQVHCKPAPPKLRWAVFASSLHCRHYYCAAPAHARSGQQSLVAPAVSGWRERQTAADVRQMCVCACGCVRQMCVCARGTIVRGWKRCSLRLL